MGCREGRVGREGGEAYRTREGGALPPWAAAQSARGCPPATRTSPMGRLTTPVPWAGRVRPRELTLAAAPRPHPGAQGMKAKNYYEPRWTHAEELAEEGMVVSIRMFDFHLPDFQFVVLHDQAKRAASMKESA